MADLPVVKLTGAPAEKPQPKQTSFSGRSMTESPSWEKQKALVEGQRLAPNFRYQRVYTGRNYSPQTRPRHQGETAQQMPNYNQLTPFERKLYEVLPGFSESTVGKALQRFSESWAGKALGYIDVFAEGAERVGGLASQAWNARGDPAAQADLSSNLSAAWYAGSLAADMTNLPTFDWDDNGLVTGLSVPDALPGATGIADARNQISELMGQGFTASEALQQTKDGYYESLGALQIRAQLNDLYSHVVADPLNLVMPYLKPIERTKALAYFASSTKWSDEVIDAARAATKALKADDLSDIQKLTALDKVKEYAKASGKMTGDFGLAFDKAVEAVDVTKAARMMDDIIGEVGISTAERAALWITGSTDPFKVSTTKAGKLYDKMPWRLTPSSRAYEYVTTIQDNVGAHIINKFNSEEEIVNAIIRASSGAIGEELGHAFLTIEGRAVQGALGGFEVEAVELYKQVLAITESGDKALLADIAKLVGKSEEELMGIMKGGDFATASKLTDGAYSAEQMETLFSALDGLPYTTRLFKYKLMNRLADRSSKLGALMFGVKQRGFVQKLAQAVKSAETLAFLRISPGYAIRNILNNEVTMIARGAGLGWNDLKKAGEYFDMDFEPVRRASGFGAIGQTFEEVPGDAIGEALTGEVGALDRFSRKLNGLNLGPFDMGTFSAKMEAGASKRAFTTSYIRGWNEYFWKPGSGFDELGSYLPTQVADSIRAVDEGLIPVVNRAVAAARNPQELQDIKTAGNLNIKVNNIVDEASETIGYDITKSMPPEIIASFRDGLEEAAQKGRIPEFMADLRRKLDDQLVEEAPRIIQKVRNDAKEFVLAEGPQAFPKILADAADETAQLGIYHARRNAELADIAKAVSKDNPELGHKLWTQMREQADAYYKRDWARHDAKIAGFADAVKEDPKLSKIANDATKNFTEIKDGWAKYWKSSRTRGDAYWKAVRDGKTPKSSWDDIAEQTGKEYREMIANEDKIQRQMDTVVGRTLEGAEQKRYLAGQADIRAYMLRDKEQVAELFDKMRLATSKEREALYQQLVTERIPRYDAIRNKQFTVSKAFEGDPAAVSKLDNLAAELPKRDTVLPTYDYTVGNKTRAELPQYVNDEVIREAERLRAELSGTGVELADAGDAVDTFKKIRVSSNPMWYRELYSQGFKNKKAVQKALDKIIDGKDVARANETYLQKIKEIVWDNLTGTEEVPADPRFMMEIGFEDEALVAFQRWIDEGLITDMSDADIAKLLGGEENYDRLYRLSIGEAPPPKAAAVAPVEKTPYVNDARELYKRTGMSTFDDPESIAKDEWWLTRGHPALDEIEKSATIQANKPVVRWDNLPEDAQKYMNSYIDHVGTQMSDARYASTRFAEYGRDASLLNYNRRYNFNTWLGTIMPYEFWTTHSMMKWAVQSIDRPAMLTSYMRLQEFMNTAGSPGQALPQRLKGQFRIPMPFLPDWAGDSMFFDPLRALLPIQNFTYGYEEEMQRMTQLEGKTEYILNDMVENGEVPREEADVAIMEKRGDLWKKAEQMAIDDNEDLSFNAWDFASLLSSPHAPLDWAVKTAQGRKEDISPFMPASRTIKGVMGLMGVDWDRSPYNMEARVRKQLGLPAFDKWDDYRIDRMLSNMTALGEITSQEALRAMIDREGDAYDEAIRKSGKEFGVGALGSTFGIPTKIYPEGEFLQRSLQDDFNKAMEMRDEEPEALENFFELHPEWETKLALWKGPEERLRSFLTDDMFSIFWEMPKVQRDDVTEQLGDDFYDKFVNQETQSLESISMEEMQVWLKLMGSDPPGTLDSDPVPIDLADPEVAWRAEVFYDTRKVYFPDFYEVQQGYYEIPEEDKAGRDAYKAENPSLEPYWEWRRDWLHRNPEVVPYLTDKPFEFKYSSPEAQKQAEQPTPLFTWDEWSSHLGPNMTPLMEDHFVRGENLTDSMQNRIEDLAERLGISYTEALDLMKESIDAQ